MWTMFPSGRRSHALVNKDVTSVQPGKTTVVSGFLFDSTDPPGRGEGRRVLSIELNAYDLVEERRKLFGGMDPLRLND